MRPVLLLALACALLAACATPESSPDAARNLQSSQPDRSAQKMVGQAFSR